MNLAYEAAGAGEPPLVLIHGWSCDSSYFAPQFEEFAHEHRVVAVDLRGHGESDQPSEGYEVESFAADVMAVAAAEQLHKPVMIGHSLGAIVALAAAREPGAVGAVVMVEPAPIVAAGDNRDVLNFATAVASDEDGGWRRSFVAQMFLETDRVRREETIELMAARPTHLAAATLRALIGFDAEDALRQCPVPVLVIGSASPLNSAEALRKVSPSVTTGQTVGAGHFVQLEVPVQVNAMISRFMAVHGLAGYSSVADRR